jgi:hypothetical protein
VAGWNLFVRGAGATNATYAFGAENSSQTALFTVRNDGAVNVSNGLFTASAGVSSTFATLSSASTLTASTWNKWTLETVGVTAKARQGSDGNGLNFTTNAQWTGSAWAEDDTTKKKFAYIQHLGNQRHEFRTAPAGSGISWTTSLTVDESTVNVASGSLQQGGNQVLHAGNYGSYSTFGGKVISGGNNGFANDVYYVGVRNPIWSFGNASSYGISYYQGAAGIGGVDTIGFSVNGTTSATSNNFAIAPGASYVNNNVILHAGNYTSYAPSLTGSGASGTWGINVTGTSGSISGYNNPTTADTPNTIAYRNGSGDIAVREITLNSGLSTATPTVLASIYPTTNQLVRTTPAAVSEAIRTAASGTWGINVTGYSTYLPTAYVGGQQLNPQTYFNNGIGLKVAMTAVAGYWSDTLWINGYAGGDVLSMCALHTSRQGTPRMWISTQQSTATSYGTLYEFLTANNYSSYALPLSGGTLTGTLYFTDTTNGIYKSGGRLTIRSESTDDVANFASYGLYLPKSGQTAGLYVESPIEARGGLRLGSGAGNGTISYGADTGVTANRLVQRDGNGYIYANHVNFNTGVENPAIANFITDNGDGWSRKSSLAHVKNQIRGIADGTWGINISGNSATTAGCTFSNDSTDKDNITTRTDSGFWQSSTGTTAEGWPRNDNTWQHLLSVTHSNDANYYAMQLSASFYNQNLYYRSTNGSGSTGWSEVLTSSSYSSYALPLSGGTLTGTVNFSSGIGDWTTGAMRVVNPGGASYATQASSVGGAIKIALPTSTLGSNTMMMFTVNVYTYDGLSFSMKIGGYNYSDANKTWYNIFAYMLTQSRPALNVRWGWDGSRPCVWIGELGSSWAYPQVTVTDIQGGYSGYGPTNFATGWSVSFETSSFYSVSNTLTVSPQLTSGNYGSYALPLSGGTLSGQLNMSGGALINAPNGFISNGNPWSTANSAFFPNGITTAGGTNWVYGLTYIGNAPGNGTGCEVSSNGRIFNTVSSGTAMHVRRTGSAGTATDSYTALFEQTYGDHSWGIVGEFRVGNSSGSDRPSILFSSGYNSNTWSVGFGSGSDDNFRINRDHGWRNSSWGTTLMVMDRSGNVTFTGNVTAFSDRRMKKDIKRLSNALALVRKLEGVSFRYREDGREGIGLVAQEVEKLIPAVVGDATLSSGETYKNVAYGNIVAVLIEAVKELADMVEGRH